MKRLFLIAGVIFTGLALSGCAKSPIGIYHSYAYYRKHKNQAEAIWETCKKIPQSVWRTKRFALSEKPKNCFNAAYALGNKKYPNLRGW